MVVGVGGGKGWLDVKGLFGGIKGYFGEIGGCWHGIG